MKTKKIKKHLHQMIENEPASIKAYVAQEALDSGDLKGFFKDAVQYGCVNGAVSSLIYYRQTHQFFDIYYNEIDELRQEYEESTGAKIDLNGDLKNALAWFAFEQTAYEMASQLNLI